MRRRNFLKNAAAGAGSVSSAQFLAYFLNFGMPAGSAKANAMAAEFAAEADEPRFLIYWFVEGGWMGYDMFNPVMTPNHVVKRLDETSEERYRVLKWGEEQYGIYTKGNIRHGYLARDGEELFGDMAVLSSMRTGSFHSGDRLRAHMGHYKFRLADDRQPDERSVMQAFAEVHGQPYLLPNLSWHWWLSDGELNEVQYGGRKGYYHALGPSHAHTIYAGTPAKLRKFLGRMHENSTDAVNRRVEGFIDDVESMLLDDDAAEAVKSYNSARSVYENMAARGRELDPTTIGTLFSNSELKDRFKIKPADEVITYRSINGNKARTKYSPAANVQAMMTYEMMRAGYTCASFIETRDIRKFDHHHARRSLWQRDGVTPRGMPDTTAAMRQDLWDPLKALVALLKDTEYKQTGKSLYDLSTIVLTSEFGRTIHGDVASIKQMPIPEADKKKMILDQDISQHWPVTSAAFLGGSVRGNSQFGRAGELTLQPIPIMPDGSLDPAYEESGVLKKDREKSPDSFEPDHGDVYATALHLADIDPAGRGRNERPPLKFIKRA